MDTVTSLGDDVFQIDTRMGGNPGITAAYLIRSARPCLVETGAGTSAPVVRDALTSLGVEPADLATVAVTHIHLDHAGGAGHMAEMYPNAEIVVHEKGARHLAEPSRLMRSARTVWGDALDTLFGELKPTDARRVRAVGEVGRIDLGGGRHLETHHSPGHAKHHIGLLDSQSGDLYVGDAVGVYIPESADLRPATPPPDFDLDTALASLAKFRALRPARLLFSHYGPVDTAGETLDRSAEELRLWVEIVAEAHEQMLDVDQAVALLLERTANRYRAFTEGGDPAAREKIGLISPTAHNVAGIMHALDGG